MKKLKLGSSFLLLILTCAITQKIVFLVNYIIALMLHELAHLYVAIKRGYSLKQFKISMFGVSVELNENVYDQDSFAINIAGPMFNLFICVLCLALYYLFPATYVILNTFCLANLVLALFNLLPVYPLDGGKIFRGLIKNNKTYKILSLIMRGLLCVIFICLFIVSGITKFNWFYLLMAVFFAFSFEKKTPAYSLFKTRKLKKIERVSLIKISEDLKLYEILKLIKTHHYSIFYCGSLKTKYIDEDTMLNYAIKNPLTLSLKDIIKN